MKKQLLALLLMAGAVQLAHAQNEGGVRPAFSAGGEIAFPSRSVFSIGYGASGKFELPVYNNKLGISVTGGYSSFVYKSSLAGGASKPAPASFIPLKGGILYYASPDLYLEAEAGAVIQQSNLNGSQPNLFAFGIGPSIMFHVNDESSQRINVGLRYETWSHNALRQLAIRVAYRFGL